MRDIIMLLAAGGLAVLISKKSGPFNILSKIRDFIFSLKYIGVSFYKLINCMYCCCFWAGLVISIAFEKFSLFSIAFAFACAFLGYIVSLIYND